VYCLKYSNRKNTTVTDFKATRTTEPGSVVFQHQPIPSLCIASKIATEKHYRNRFQSHKNRTRQKGLEIFFFNKQKTFLVYRPKNSNRKNIIRLKQISKPQKQNLAGFFFQHQPKPFLCLASKNSNKNKPPSEFDKQVKSKANSPRTSQSVCEVSLLKETLIERLRALFPCTSKVIKSFIIV
jgi:hypothetical protein